VIFLFNENVDRVYSTIVDFIQISGRFRGAKYFYLTRRNAEKSKYWKYFVEMDEMAQKGEIVLPDFIEAQFLSKKWGNVKILPNQMTSKRAMEVWSGYIKGRRFQTKKRGTDSESVLQSFFNQIRVEVKMDNFYQRFVKDDKFDIEFYLDFKSIIAKDLVYKVFVAFDFAVLKAAFSVAAREEKTICTSYVEEIEDCKVDNSNTYVEIVEERTRRFITVLKGLLRLKLRLGKKKKTEAK